MRTPLPQPAGHLLLLNFDGADLDTILTLQAQGKLPGFMRLREEGAFGRLQSIVPCEAAVTRTTLATGRRPYRHGVRSGLARRMFGRGPALEVVPVGIGFDLLLGPAMAIRPTSVSDRSGRSLWEIASDAGGTGEAVGFDVDLDRDGDRVTVTAGSGSASALAPILDPETIRRAEPALQGQLGELRAALRADRWVESSLDRLAGDARSGVAALSFPGLDRVAHVFLRYARPQEFGNVTGREVDLYGEVLERYYRWVDAIVGRAIDAAGARGWVMVTSSHGIEPAALRRRLLEMATGGEAPSGDHDAGPDGVLFMHGPGIARGPLKGKGTIADVVPTALYALKLPVARDLDGAILTGLFTARYILEHPVTVIGSYETP